MIGSKLKKVNRRPQLSGNTSSTSSLAAQAAALTFSKTSGGTNAGSDKLGTQSLPENIKIRRRLTDHSGGSSSSIAASYASSPPKNLSSDLKAKLKKHQDGGLSTPPSRVARSRSSGILKFPQVLDKKPEDSLQTALTAAALAAKTISARAGNHQEILSPSAIQNKATLLSTGFLQPPSDLSRLLKPPCSPVGSNRSVLSFTSDNNYSLNKGNKYEGFSSSESLLDEPEARKVLTKASRKKVGKKSSLASFSDRSVSQESEDQSKLRNITPPALALRDSVYTVPSLSQLSLPNRIHSMPTSRRASSDISALKSHLNKGSQEQFLAPQKINLGHQLTNQKSNQSINSTGSSVSRISNGSVPNISRSPKKKSLITKDSFYSLPPTRPLSHAALNDSFSYSLEVSPSNSVDWIATEEPKKRAPLKLVIPQEEKQELEEPFTDYESEESTESDGELPQYPLTVAEPAKSHMNGNALKQKGKKVLRDWGIKHNPDHMPSPKTDINMYNGRQLQAIGTGAKPVLLRKTMRKEKKKQKDFNEDKPWKHHRSIIVTEQEKKRYEGVWVANRGLYMNLMHTPINSQEDDSDTFKDCYDAVNALSSSVHPGPCHPSQLVHGYVVRTIWRRSNLSDSILEKIWDLVSLRQDGTLNRDEFICGMWLVDQCLYGRKLPQIVSADVWSSAKKLTVSYAMKKKNIYRKS